MVRFQTTSVDNFTSIAITYFIVPANANSSLMTLAVRVAVHMRRTLSLSRC